MVSGCDNLVPTVRRLRGIRFDGGERPFFPRSEKHAPTFLSFSPCQGGRFIGDSAFTARVGDRRLLVLEGLLAAALLCRIDDDRLVGEPKNEKKNPDLLPLSGFHPS